MTKNPNYLNHLQIAEILRNGYPSEDELNQIPLGKFLRNIPEVNTGFQSHMIKVMKGINILLGDEPHMIVKEWENAPNKNYNFFITLLNSIFGSEKEKGICQFELKEIHSFLRLCALYHDIGKNIIHERHPTIGWHLIKDVSDFKIEMENKLCPLLLNIPYDEWDEKKGSLTDKEKRLIYIFEMVVKFHDLFGTLSTGEASLPVMVDLIPLLGEIPKYAKELFSFMMIVNLADLYGSVKELYPYKIESFIEDWKILCETIDEDKADGNRSNFFERLTKISQSEIYTVKRLERLMKEGVEKRYWEGISDQIQDAFISATLATQKTFCKNFALFCKMDYALSFKIKIMQYCIDKEKDSGKDVKEVILEPMHHILWLIVQLVRQYGDLCQHTDGSYRRIGLQLAGLTRKPASGEDKGRSRIGDTICRLLVDTQKGKEWAASECTVWFMEE